MEEVHQYIHTQRHLDRIQDAYTLAYQAHQGALRKSGEPYILHPVQVALLLAEMRIDADGIIAALLHDVVEDTNLTLDELQTRFGPAVATIVDGVTKFAVLSQGPSFDKKRAHAETVRKLFAAMAQEPRVIALKVADRLHNMRTLDAMSVAHQQKTARETREIYIPLARRLGMSLALAELEDLALLYLEPEVYATLAQEVAAEVPRRLLSLNEIGQFLESSLSQTGIAVTIQAQQKHLASIRRKVAHLLQHGSEHWLHQIHDLISLDIIVETDDQCYLALGQLHACWRPKDGGIKDFIATPKLNGYQALHTTVFGPHNSLVEIHIYTRDMLRLAHYGLASYWYLRERYHKVGLQQGAYASWWISYREMTNWMEQLRQWQRALPQSTGEFLAAFQDDLFQKQVFVFTPAGNVIDLPRGATPLDLAYRLGSDIGDHCAGARITTRNQEGLLVTRLAPLDYELKEGDIVDILSQPDVTPNHEWLSFAHTAAARNKIRHALKLETPIDDQKCSKEAKSEQAITGAKSITLCIHANDRAGLLRDVADLLTRTRLNILSLNSETTHGQALLTVVVQPSTPKQGLSFLTPLLHDLCTIKGVIQVQQQGEKEEHHETL
ncbi:bifunctional (p)ppGpp synthetase/guanosine-3',5'-bis(diphosphate) 3'-pyrophosphohydrolase [Ktedonobacter robiniae]|nr:HD domain-containing protein [Ktedonobacter robiniae]